MHQIVSFNYFVHTTQLSPCMLTDVNIDYNYRDSDKHLLDAEDWTGYCINKVVLQSNIRKSLDYDLPFTLQTKKLYKRITLMLENNSTPPKSLLKNCDVLCLHVRNLETPIDETSCDLVCFDMTKPIKLKNINPNVFYEIQIVDSLYNKKDRMMWMYNVKMLLSFTKGRNVVIGTGASCFTEQKSPLDIIKMLQVFGVSEDKARNILDNNNKLLRKCAEKRFIYEGCIFTDIPEGRLKEDYLLNQCTKKQ